MGPLCQAWPFFPSSSSSVRLLSPPLLAVNCLSCSPLGGPGPPSSPHPRWPHFPRVPGTIPPLCQIHVQVWMEPPAVVGRGGRGGGVLGRFYTISPCVEKQKDSLLKWRILGWQSLLIAYLAESSDLMRASGKILLSFIRFYHCFSCSVELFLYSVVSSIILLFSSSLLWYISPMSLHIFIS